MAIKGMTDQQASLPIIGVLRKGEEKPDRGPGRDLDYFRFTSDDPQALEMFFDAYPDKPRQINVFLPHKTTDENMDSWIEKWVAGGLVYRSDGEIVVLYRNDKGQYSTEPKPDPSPPVGEDGKRQDGSAHVGRLSVIVPELGRLATITVLTTSKNDIIKLTRQLRGYEALNGDLRGIPFVLKRRFEKVSTPGKNGARVRREKWMLSIETKPEWSMAKLLQSEAGAYPQLPGETAPASNIIINQLPPNVIAPFDEPESEYETQPEPKAPPPTSPADLMFLVNEKLGTEYKAVKHMLNAIRKHTGMEDYDWPGPDDVDGWKFAYKQIADHKTSKATEQPPSLDDVDEIPF